MVNETASTIRLRKFDAEHGESVRHNGWLYFIDGACRELNPMGASAEPPTNAQELAKNIQFFHKIRTAKAFAAFEDEKAKILNLTGSSD